MARAPEETGLPAHMRELELTKSILAHDCDEIQGYYFSKPLPQVEPGKWLGENRALDF